MRKLAIALCVATLCGPAAASSDLTESVKKALAAWSPTEIILEDGLLGIALPQKKVTNETYSVVVEWLCANVSSGRISLKDVKEIAVVNRFGGQGFVFEGGAGQCRGIADVPRGKVNVPLLDRTRLWTKR